MQVNTPLTKTRVTVQSYEGEQVFEPHTTVLVKDQQDQLNITSPGALRQGLLQHTNVMSYSWVEGVRSYARTVRGNRASTMTQVQRAETLNLTELRAQQKRTRTGY